MTDVVQFENIKRALNANATTLFYHNKRFTLAQELQRNYFSNTTDELIYSRTSMARTPLNHENIFDTGVVRANECKS